MIDIHTYVLHESKVPMYCVRRVLAYMQQSSVCSVFVVESKHYTNFVLVGCNVRLHSAKCLAI